MRAFSARREREVPTGSISFRSETDWRDKKRDLNVEEEGKIVKIALYEKSE